MKKPISRKMVAAFIAVLGALALPLVFGADGPDQPAPVAKAERFGDHAFKIISVIHEQHVKQPTLASLVRWAFDGLYREAGEPIPAGIADRIKGVAFLDAAGMKKLLAAARDGIKDRPGVGDDWALFAAAAGIFRHLEPNSDPKSWLWRDDIGCTFIHGRFQGLGLMLEAEAADGSVRVTTPIYGGPAYRAGIRAGDRIVRIVEERPGERPRDVEIGGKPLEAIVDALRGPEQAIFQMHVQRPGGKRELVDVRPGRSEVETVMGSVRGADDRWLYIIPHEPAIGYIRIKSFGPDTHKSLKEVLTTHPDVRGWVFDLRCNEGGLLSSAYQTSELFVGTRRIMSISPGRKDLPPINYDGEELAVFKDHPVVCLVNGKTQRCAEIVAACLQDQGKALIVGERTAGWADLQNIQGVLGGDLVLKVTTAVFVRPNGKSLSRYMSAGRSEDDWGVIPDAGMDCRLSHDETDQLAAAVRNAEAIFDPAFRPKTNVVDRQLELALSAVRARIENQ